MAITRWQRVAAALSTFAVTGALLVATASPAEASTTYRVDSTLDTGGNCDATPSNCTLRQAINSANAHGGADAISFAIASPGPWTIAPATALPAITDPVTVDATSQPGFAGEPVIEIDGTNAPSGTHGLSIVGTHDVTVRGFVVNRFPGGAGVFVDSSERTHVETNYLGTDPTGSVAEPNNYGVWVNGGRDHVIGGQGNGLGNVLSGNGYGAYVTGTDTTYLFHNAIGTDLARTATIPNFAGVVIGSSTNTTVGGAGAPNWVAHNSGWGISPQTTTSASIQTNQVWDNAIGVYATGAGESLIGGNLGDQGNEIYANGIGIKILSGSDVRISQNSIHDNRELAIDLDGDGVTANDPSDADTGPNGLQNFPDLVSAVDDSATTSVIYGTLDAIDAKPYQIELFANDECDASGHGEAQVFIGTASATGGGNWNAHLNWAHPGRYITAVAIDPVSGDTSELSNCVLEQAATPPFSDPVVNTVADHDDGACQALDAGDCTLREAILAANAHPGADTIAFGIPGAGVHSIQPATDLPAITEAVLLDATTQSGAAPRQPAVVLDGVDNPNWSAVGLTVSNADAVTVRGLGIVRFPYYGVVLDTATNSHIETNLIGTDAAGTPGLGNGGAIGLIGGSGNVIGGPVDTQGNVLASSGAYGVDIQSSATNTLIQHNHIGTDVTDTASLGNYAGVVVRDSSYTFIRDNTVAANHGWGISPQGGDHTIVQNNVIGLASADDSLANGTGIYALGVATHDLYGGIPGSGNVIAHNLFDGIQVGTSNNGVTIEGNSIFDNGRYPFYSGQGIALDFDGVTANDPGDADEGANHLQNHPDLTDAATDGTHTAVHGILDSDPSRMYRVEVFANDLCSATGAGEGQTLLGAGDVRGDGQPFALVVDAANEGAFVTTTATDLTTGDTSEFSMCQPVTAGPPVFVDPVVNTLDDHDDGVCDTTDCSLREAINATEGHPGHDRITFSVTGTIQPGAPLPQIRDAVTIDGTGGSCAPAVGLDGSNAGGSARGLQVIGTDGTVIRGLAIGHFGFAGIGLDSNTHLVIECNYIGLALDGSDAGNTAGVRVDGDMGDTIGGTASSRNVISGNDAEGVRVSNAAFNTIAGNYIGTDPSGANPVPNSVGLFLTVHATDTTVGPDNVISGNQARGVAIETTATNNEVFGNIIGAAPNGVDPVDPAPTQIGVELNGADGNVVGGTAPTAGNTLAHNYVGVIVVLNTGAGNDIIGNRITGSVRDGVNLNGAVATTIGGTGANRANTITGNGGAGVLVRGGADNRVSRNSIHDNGELGIDLAPSLNDAADGVTANDSGDGDSGGNHLQNFPAISSAVSDGTTVTVTGSLDSNPAAAYSIELFGNSACDASGNGEGATFLGTINASGNSSQFTTSVPASAAGAFVTATATDGSGNTSEFSACRAVTVTPPPPPHCAAADTVDGIVVSAPPADLTLDATESDDCVLLFIEQQDVTLTSGLTAKPPASGNAMAQNNITVPAGTVVNSYYLHYDPADNANGADAQATYTFENDVIGFVVDSTVLHDSDAALGMPDASHTTGIAYPTDGQGLEAGGGATGDLVSVASDGRTVTFHFHATSGADHVRVLTGTPPPFCTLGGRTNAIHSDPPADLRLGRTESNECMLLFDEQQGVTLTAPLQVKDPSSANVVSGPDASLPAGSVVNSYFVHIDSIGQSHAPISGVWTFDNDVVGFIVSSSALDQTNALLGIPDVATGLRYQPSGQGLEPPSGDPARDQIGDKVWVEADRRTVHFQLQTTGGADQLRVLTGSYPPFCTDAGSSLIHSNPPRDLRTGMTESNQCVLLFDEQQNVTLTQALTVYDPTAPQRTRTLPPGTVVTSAFVHFDSIGTRHSSVSKSWTFSDDVLGFVVASGQLDQTNTLLGIADVATGLRYPAGGQGLEISGSADTQDSLALGADRRTVTFNLQTTAGADQVRVLTGHLPSGRVSVQKVTNPAHSGQGFQFTLQRTDAAGTAETVAGVHDGDAPRSFAAVPPGTYALTELAVAGWDTTVSICDNRATTATESVAPASLTVAANDDWLCAFTNTQRAVVSVRKVTVPANDPQPFDFALRRSSDNGIEAVVGGVRATDAGATAFAAVRPGSYSLIEPAVAHWDQTAATCDNSDTTAQETVSASTLSIGAGTHWLCTFTNQKRGSVTVRKTAVGGDGTFAFALTSQGTKSITTSNGTGSAVWTDVPAGDYSLTEDVTAVAGVFDLTGLTCTVSSTAIASGRSFHLSPGQDVSCTFTNTKRGHLIIKKVTDDGATDGNPDFTFTGAPGGTVTMKAGGTADVSVVPGAYQVTETAIPSNWVFRGVACTDPSGGTTTSGTTASYGIAAGETVTCTYTNHWVRADLKVEVVQPAGAYVGDPFTVQVRVTNLGPDSATSPVVTATLSPNAVLTSGLPNACTQPQPANPQLIRCNLGTMAPGAVVTGSVSVRSKVVGSNCTIWGGSGNDVLNGTGTADVICGLAGQDEIHAGPGNDEVWGDNPPNALATFNVVDTATVTSVTPDPATANNAASATTLVTLRNNDGVDRISGDTGADKISGGGAGDFLYGDAFESATGTNDGTANPGFEDEIHGGSGDDRIWGQSSDDLLYGDAGDDVLSGQAGDDKMYGDGGRDVLEGGSGVDQEYGQADNDALHGGSARGSDKNLLDGGAGTDCASNGPDITVNIEQPKTACTSPP